MNYFLRELGFERNRFGIKEDGLIAWLAGRCLVPSGRFKRYFIRGTEETMYYEYLCYCVEKGISKFYFKPDLTIVRVGLCWNNFFS